jgi:hypothetical protein
MTLNIVGDNPTETQYNSVRNAVNRLEKSGNIQTLIVPVYNKNTTFFRDKPPSKLKMMRLSKDNRKWDCEKGIHFEDTCQLSKELGYCKI